MEWRTEGCGGYLTHEEGEFTSPNYPKAYPLNLVCEWIIEVEYGRNIEVNVIDLDIEASPGCEYDELVFALDSNYTNKILSMCDRKTNITITGNGHKMYVKFFTDTSHSGRGFRATYRAAYSSCGGIFEGLNGVLYSPNYPKVYNPNQICEWEMKTDVSHRILFRFMELDIENTENCTKDYVEILDPISNKSLFKGCDQIPETNNFLSEYNKLLLVLKTGPGTIHAKGFKANYTTACGSRILTNDSGEIRLRRDHIAAENCSWIIKADDPAKKVTLTITYLYVHVLDEEDGCETLLTVRDGETDDGPIRYQNCGEKPPKAIVSNGNALRVSINVPANVVLSIEEFDAHYSVLENGKCDFSYFLKNINTKLF